MRKTILATGALWLWRRRWRPLRRSSSSTCSPAAPAASTIRWASRSAKIYGKTIPEASPVQATKASVENLNLLQAGQGEIAFALGDSVKLAWTGNTDAGFPGKLDKLRGIAAIYPNYIQIVASRGLRHQDAGRPQGQAPVGRRAASPAPSSTPGRSSRAAGIDLRRPRQGRVPAVRRIGRADEEPPARRHAAVGRARRRLDPRPRQLDADHGRGRSRPTWSRRSAIRLCAGDHPGRHLQGPGRDVPTAAIVNFLITQRGGLRRSRLCDDQACSTTWTSWRRPTPPPRRSSRDKALVGMPVPLHPGAERYYRENGLDVSDRGRTCRPDRSRRFHRGKR